MSILKKNRFIFLICVHVLLLFHIACSNQGVYGNEEAEEILSEVLSKINNNQQIVLQGTSEVSISGYTFVEPESIYKESNQQWIKVNDSQEAQNKLPAWNTLLKIEQLQNVNKTVTIDNTISEDNLMTIQIDIEPRNLRELITSNLLLQLEQIEQAEASMIPLGEQHQADKQDAIVQARNKLEEMLQTLTAHSRYQLGVERDRLQAQTLRVETTLQYLSEGIEREETIKGMYHFK